VTWAEEKSSQPRCHPSAPLDRLQTNDRNTLAVIRHNKGERR
jgi:hypothetical protein